MNKNDKIAAAAKKLEDAIVREMDLQYRATTTTDSLERIQLIQQFGQACYDSYILEREYRELLLAPAPKQSRVPRFFRKK